MTLLYPESTKKKNPEGAKSSTNRHNPQNPEGMKILYTRNILLKYQPRRGDTTPSATCIINFQKP